MNGNSRATIVLLHGLGLGGWAMLRIAWTLRRAGHRVINLTYRSRSVRVEELARTWLPRRLELAQVDLQRPASLRFVTHSMGGLVLRSWLHQHGVPPALHRAVMIAPPNQGTRLVERIGHWWLFRLFTGVNGHRLGTRADDLPQQLPAWPTGPELGIIAGDISANPWLASLTGRPGDGKVQVDRTRLAGMRDHLVMHHSHTWLQYRGAVVAQVDAFLQNGCFNR